MLIVYFLILFISFYYLAKICDDYFVESLDEIASRLKMSSDAAGATLMAVGSSAPELFVAIIAVLKPGNHETIGMGNIVGSAIFNVLVITGSVGIIKQFFVTWHIVIRDLLFYLLSILLLLYVFIDGSISLSESLIFLSLYAIYVLIVVKWKNYFKSETETIITHEEHKKDDNNDSNNKKHNKLTIIFKPFDFIVDKLFFSKNHIFVFFLSIILIGFFSWLLVEGAIGIAHILEIPEIFIALTILAVGTSVPDLLSSIIVGKQGRGGMAVSNAIGSNIFDILIGLGIPFLIIILINGGTVEIKTTELISSVGILIFSVVLILFLMIINKWNVGKKMGITLVAFYILYLIWQFIDM